MKYLKLTNAYNGLSTFVDSNKINAIGENLDGTYIYINGCTVSVDESPEEILKLINEPEATKITKE